MRAIILASGRGTRFGQTTLTTPKSLIKVGGKELIKYGLDALPNMVTECIIVIGYLGSLVKDRIGYKYKNIRIQYVWQEEDKTGTGAALMAAKNLLQKTEMFLVINSDDIYDQGELVRLIVRTASYGIFWGIPSKSSTQTVLFSQSDFFLGFDPAIKDGLHQYFGVGAYFLPYQIFTEKFSTLPNGEISIPHSLENMPFPIKVIKFKNWCPVNNHWEREIAERHLSK